MASVSRQLALFRKRWITRVNSCAKASTALCTETGRLMVAFEEQRIELLLADVLDGLVAERVIPELAQRLAPLVHDGVEGAPARPVSDKALFVTDLEIVAIDFNARQLRSAMFGNDWQVGIL